MDAPAVIAWFASHRRSLPWRRQHTSPWAILVSEVMLQQTPVTRVAPAFDQWMAQWPAPADLAAESPAAAIRAWGRLGYPRRALRLHQCAATIVAEHGGAVPSTVPELLALPGIGAYTARAVAAFAYQRREPVVDVNVRRVLARAVRGVGSAGSATTPADFATMAELLPADGATAATFSAGVMELGALVCVERSPRCDECPIATDCAWRRAGHPAYDRASRTQTYEGTDRQARGRLLALLRATPHPVSKGELLAVWPEVEQRERALASLVDDGLVHRITADQFALPA